MSKKAPVSTAPLDELFDSLAQIAGRAGGAQGEQLRLYIEQVRPKLDNVIQAMNGSESEEQARRDAATELDALIEAVMGGGSERAKALGLHRAQLHAAFEGVPLDKLAVGLHHIADYLRNPEAEHVQNAPELIAKLQDVMGPHLGYDPVRAEQERRQKLKEDVRKSLDEIFQGIKPPKFT